MTSPAQLDEASRVLMAQCPLYVRDILIDGRPAGIPFIRPEHIARLDAASKSYPEESPGMLVTLTSDGEEQMRRHSEQSSGRTVAVFCGSTEISRATIHPPVGNPFKVELLEEGA